MRMRRREGLGGAGKSNAPGDSGRQAETAPTQNTLGGENGARTPVRVATPPAAWHMEEVPSTPALLGTGLAHTCF